ncbi:site-specific DNA-methyltransferase (adenine-specific) [human gut metagenome]|uniref:Site-specific DNA-methyltransferase (Adenine-specific) n=1 Tax=human gut metagenome TaxID=408170 RepID=K1RFR3_9ZZZZ
MEKNNKNIVKIDNYESSNWIPYVKYYLDGRTKKVSNLLQNIEGNKKGSLQLKELFEINNLFDNPKPLEFLSILINIGSEDGDTILDFFGGSSSTAHSVLKINSENNGNRKFIIVQLPELCDTKSEAYKNGYKTIDEIGQERIRRAAKKIKEGTNADIDYGFKHYTIKEVNTNTLDKLEKFEPNYVISDGSILDEFGINAVLTTWMNEDGYGLTDKYEKLELEDYTAYKCQNTIYLLNWNISDLFIKALIEKYEKDENFDCNRIVMFGYSFTLNDIQTLKDNLQQVKNIKGINVEVITRY